MNQQLPYLTSSPQASPNPDKDNIEIRLINNPIMALKCLSEKKIHTSLTLNKKLDVIKFNEEGMSKAKIG